MRQLEFFFDYECPYCKRGYEYLLKHLPEHPDIELIWRPCEAHPRPEAHPPHTDLAIQGYFFAAEQGVEPTRYHTRLFEAVHVDRIDVEDPKILTEYVKDLVDPDQYFAALRGGDYKTQQEQGNDYAYEENDVWFLPAFRMEGHKLDAEGGIGVSEAQVSEFLQRRS